VAGRGSLGCSASVPHCDAGAIDDTVAKAGGRMLALSAANELTWHGIRVNLIEPGWTAAPPGERT
jgi:NAD(P)-dependent dehydrogenase (short-subunit alcohol dehydrogenase family)